VKAIAPEIRSGGTVRAFGESSFAQITGITSNYAEVRNFEIASGRFISPVDVRNNSEVVVLGSSVSTNLFGNRDPVGVPVRVGNKQFTVIGVLESKGGNAFGIEDLQVMVPITTAYYRLSSTRTGLGEITVTSINAQVADVDDMALANEEMSTLLFLRHGGEEDFTITNQEDTIETLQSTESTFVLLLGAIAGISLLVGGIGIMNIMMVSVTERTREIGIRKAMGAKRRDIAMQFLAEATFLSIGGGIVGVGLGLGISALADGTTIGGEQLATVFSGDVALLALVVSAGVGLFFGIYPAIRAARLHPIEALRHE
jgi:putative ABC transport system permease protein